MNDRVIKYFNAVAEKLSAEHSISSTIKNPSDIGYARENLLKGFLNNHIPGRLSAEINSSISIALIMNLYASIFNYGTNKCTCPV